MKSINFTENRNVVRNASIEFIRKAIAAYKVLDNAKVVELITEAQNGSQRAKEQVINANLRIVWSIAASYGNMDFFEDIYQNGCIGLIKAVETFDVSRGTMFSTWALEQVRKYINIALTNESRTVRLGAHQIKCDYNTTSMDAPLANDGEDKDKCFGDTFSSDSRADNLCRENDMKVKISYLLSGLKDREKDIICSLFGIGCTECSEYTLSLRYNMTEERIRQIKWEALKKMKDMA